MREDGFYLPTRSSSPQLTLYHWMSSGDTERDKDGLKFRYTKDRHLKHVYLFSNSSTLSYNKKNKQSSTHGYTREKHVSYKQVLLNLHIQQEKIKP